MNQTVLLRYEGPHEELFVEWLRQFFNVGNIRLEKPLQFQNTHIIAYQSYKQDNIVKAIFIKLLCFFLFKKKMSNGNLYRFAIDLNDQIERIDNQNFQSINVIESNLEEICPNIQYDISIISVQKFKECSNYLFVMRLLKLLTNEYCKKLAIIDCEKRNCVCYKVTNLQELDRIDIIPCNYHIGRIGNIVGRTFDEQSKILVQLTLLMKDFFLMD